MRLFTYGTLKKGGKYHHYLAGAERIAECATLTGTLYDTELGYPAMVLTGEDTVKGEVYEVPDELWAMLDEVEDCTGRPDDLYEKMRTKVQTGNDDMETIVYTARNPNLLKRRMKCGVWNIGRE